jgi:hypothetical protein
MPIQLRGKHPSKSNIEGVARAGDCSLHMHGFVDRCSQDTKPCPRVTGHAGRVSLQQKEDNIKKDGRNKMLANIAEATQQVGHEPLQVCWGNRDLKILEPLR